MAVKREDEAGLLSKNFGSSDATDPLKLLRPPKCCAELLSLSAIEFGAAQMDFDGLDVKRNDSFSEISPPVMGLAWTADGSDLLWFLTWSVKAQLKFRFLGTYFT